MTITTIVGSYDNGSGSHAFLYNGTTWTTLDYPGVTAILTSATDISGTNIVGTTIDSNNKWHSWLYNGNVWTELNYPGATWTDVEGISGNRVVGYYEDSNHARHGFILTIPEPATLSLLAIGGLAIVRRGQGQRV